MGYKKSRLTKPQIEERRARAMRLRAAGLTYDQIAQQIETYSSKQSVHKDIMAGVNKDRAEAAAELRAVELERLDAAHRKVYEKVLSGDLKAMDMMLRLQTRRARYVPGLEVPQEHELGTQGAPIQVVFHPSLAQKTRTEPTSSADE